MGKVVSHMTMSPDGFIADPHDDVSELFGWCEAGTVAVPSADERWSFQVDDGSAQMLREVLAGTGALVCGRRLFDHTSGWGDRHPIGAPVVVVTHHPLTMLANRRPSPSPRAAQALELSLIDEVIISLVPVLLEQGIPDFAGLARAPHRFDDPVVIPGSRVTT